uniref:Uncharacterized protein n=1 Tax=Oryza brachyantha TaxID=4533 RepID=J3KZD1_ORYBR
MELEFDTVKVHISAINLCFGIPLGTCEETFQQGKCHSSNSHSVLDKMRLLFSHLWST